MLLAKGDALLEQDKAIEARATFEDLERRFGSVTDISVLQIVVEALGRIRRIEEGSRSELSAVSLDDSPDAGNEVRSPT